MSTINNNSQLNEDLVQWLRDLSLEEHFNNTEIQSGRLIGQIMSKVVDDYKLELMNSNSAVNRVSNWNNLVNQLKNINIRVSQDEKAKIINGNKDIIYQIMYKLKDYQLRNRKQNEVDISKINAQTVISDSTSLLELLILSIMKYFNLNSKESVALLSNESRYLAHILAKGFKGEFKPVQNLLKELLDNNELLYQFCSKNKENQQFLIRAIKPALISKSDTVSKLGLELLDNYIQRTHSQPSHSQHKLDLLKEYLLATLLLGIKRHPHHILDVLDFILRISQNYEGLLLLLKNELVAGSFNVQRQSEYQNVLITIFQIMKSHRNTEKFLNFKGIKEIVGRVIGNIKNVNLAINSLNFILQIAIQCPELLIDTPESNRFIENLEQVSSMLSKRAEQTTLIQQLFTLLSVLGEAKIYYAPSIYKILVNKYNDTLSEETGKVFLQNFCQIIKQFPSIPHSMITSSINSKLETNKLSDLSESELAYFKTVIECDGESGEGLDQKNTLVIYNCVSKLMIQSAAYSHMSSEIILSIQRKYAPQFQIFNDLTNKLIKVCLAVHFANIRRLHQNMAKSRRSISAGIDPQDIVMRAKNLAIQQFLYKIVSEGISEINTAAEPLISYSLIQIESIDKDLGVGLRKIIQLFGDPAQVLKKYEAQAKKLDEENARKEEANKKSKVKQQGSWGANNRSRSPNEISHIKSPSNIVSSDEVLATKKMSTGRYSKIDHTIFQSQLGVNPDAKKGLEKYHKVYLSKIEKIEKEETKKKQEEERKKYLQKIFERKMLDKGIEVKKVKDEQYQYIYQFNEKEKQMATDIVKGRIILPYYEATDEEDRDIKGLEYTMKKYNKVLKVYYNQYSGHHRPKNLDSFDQIAEKYSYLYSASVIRMIKEHCLDEFLSVREIQTICKNINKKLNKQMDNPTTLDFDGFQQFVLQASFVMFSRPPKDLSGRPISQMIQQTLSRLKMYAHQNRVNQKLFDDPDNVFINQTQAVRELNRKLANNPDYILPQGYKKISEKKVFFTHRIFLDAMSQSYKDVYEVVDELLQKSLAVHIIEPFTTFQTTSRARPALYHNQKYQGDVTTQKLSISMKKQVLKFPIKDRQIAKNSAIILEEIIEAVEMGHDRIGIKHQNKALKSKKMELESLRIKEEQQNKKWEQRRGQIKSALLKHKQVKEEKINEEKQKKKEQKQRQEQKERKRKQEQERLKKRVEEYQEKKREDQERRRKEDKEKRKRQKQEAEKKKKQAQEIKRKIEEFKSQKEQEEAAKRKEEQALKKQQRQQQKRKYEEEQKRKKQMVEEYKNSKGLGTSKVNS